MKLLVIIGPTASGKTALAIQIAKKLNGEVISADSRQVYKGLNIGTGKVNKKEMSGIPHHMLDVASPKRVYTVSDYKINAEKAIEKIFSKNKLPIICGGTGFYIDTLIYNRELPDVPTNKELRKKLLRLSVQTLFSMIEKKDPDRAKTIDRHNIPRLIRALEIIDVIGKVPHIENKKGKYDVVIIGIKTDLKDLEKKITKRLHARIKLGMIREVERLHENGLSWKRMEMLGLEYRYVSRYLRGLISKEVMIEELNTAIIQYAKRQMTWFRANTQIHWIDSTSKHELKKAISSFS